MASYGSTLGGVSGSGTAAANYIAYWTSAYGLTGTAGLTYDGTTLTHTPTASIASGASATANLHTVAAATVTITGGTSITTALGFNIASIKQATLSAASALTITSAAGLYVESPIGGGAGPATLTNEHAIWGLGLTARTNTTSDVLRLEHNTSGTPAAGFGVGILFRGLDGSKTAGGDDIARIAGTLTTVTSGAEVSSIVFQVRTAGGALTTRMTIAGNGLVTFVNGISCDGWTTAASSTSTMGSAANIATNTGTGTIIATTTSQKLGFWGVTAVVQYSTTGTATGFGGTAGTTVGHTSTFTGNLGSTAYTIGDVVLALKTCGIMLQ